MSSPTNPPGTPSASKAAGPAAPPAPPLSDQIPGAEKWPYGAALARKTLDPELIEQHAEHVLARALSCGRLVVFAGAGVSMAYGRMTWAQLLDALYRQQTEHEAQSSGASTAAHTLADPYQQQRLQKQQAFDRQRWGALNKSLWPGGVTDFHANKRDYTITAQLFGEFGIDADSPMKPEVARLLESSWEGFRLLAGALGASDNQIDAIKSSYGKALTARRSGPRSAPNQYLSFLGGLLGPNAPSVNLDDLQEEYLSAYGSFNCDQASPLSLLVNQWGVRRLLTTNYDAEIENALKAFDYATDGAAPEPLLHGTRHESAMLNRNTTGAAMCFAVDGARRHASVLHLHGECEAPESLIVTEADYQALYVDKHETRDLVENAISANFAANPLLFVGSGVAEDDILRPLRQFVTGPAHQRDRMVVALLPVSCSPSSDVYNTLKLYLRFGAHTVFYGYVHEGTPGSETRVPWLGIANDLLNKVDKLALAVSHDKDLPDHPIKKAVVNSASRQTPPVTPSVGVNAQCVISWCDGLKEHPLVEPSDPEGIKLYGTSQGFLEALQRAVDEADVLWSEAKAKDPLMKDQAEHRAKRLKAYSEELRTTLTSFFFCASLLRLHRRATHLQDEDLRIPSATLRSYEELHSEEDDTWPVFHRHQVAQVLDAPESHAVKELIAALKLPENANFAKRTKRRVLIVCGKRGDGLGAMFDDLGRPERARALAEALQHYGATAAQPHTSDVIPIALHLNLSFSDEISTAVAQIVAVIWGRLGVGQPPATQDTLERLALALDRLCDTTQAPRGRCLLMIGNAGALFTLQGTPKNGLIARVLQLLASKRYAPAPLDLVLFCYESRVPAEFRIANDSKQDRRGLEDSLTSSQARERHRRLARLNICVPSRFRRHTVIFPQGPCQFDQVRGAVLANPPALDRTPANDLGAIAHHRFALTMVLAYAAGAQTSVRSPDDLIKQVKRRVETASRDAAAERAIEAVLDGWYQRHLRSVDLPSDKPTRMGEGTTDPRVLSSNFSRYRWLMVSEILWHLSMFSRPVEVGVLLACESIHKALWGFFPAPAAGSDGPERQALLDLLVDVLRLMEQWCLVYRICPRTVAGRSPSDASRRRYTVHRLVQKHHLRLTGGRNAESSEWDQFTTTLYASQPDEVPALPGKAHQKLVTLVKTLSRYPDPALAPHAAAPAADLEDRLDCLRAAYFLVRSNFSLGVMAHSADAASQPSVEGGVMEEYRRLVRWITRAAVLWEDEANPLPAATGRTHRAAFFSGELVWLLNESGVIALAQGKLDDADRLLGLTEQAAQQIEADNSGSIHVRIRLHTALVQIERGRPSRAKAILEPILARRHGHEVPPLIAAYYLGLIEHIGGNYIQAMAHYDKAIEGLRDAGRSRALAFVLQAKADLHHVLHPNDLPKSLEKAAEAISLAQQGGHEDVRVIAMLTQVRLQADDVEQQRPGLFEKLAFAEQYASRMEMPRIACEVHEVTARLLLSQGEVRMSAARASASLEIAALYDLKLMKARALLTLAQIYLQRGDRVGAAHLVGLGKSLATSADYFSVVRGFRDLELKLNVQP